MKNSLLEKLASELGGKVLSEIPKGAVSSKMLADETGRSVSLCEKKLRASELRGELKRISVRPAGQRMPRVFFVSA